MVFKKLLFIAAIPFSIALSLFGIIYITQPTNAAISPILFQEKIGIEEIRISVESRVASSELREKPVTRYPLPVAQSPDNPITRLSDPLPFPLSHFLTRSLSPFLAQDGVDFELPLSDSFALVSNFPSLKKQAPLGTPDKIEASDPEGDGLLLTGKEEGNSSLSLVNFDQDALVGLRYTHQGTIWDTKVKVVTGLASPDGGYRFILSLTKNF